MGVGSSAPAVRESKPQMTDEERVRLIACHREDIRQLANGQKFLLIGGHGHGRSSLINSLNHVLRLENPTVPFQEIAKTSSGCSVCTTKLTSYTAERGLFKGVTSIPDEKKPTFFDVTGMSENDRVGALTLIPKLALGQIPEDLNLSEITQKGYDKVSFPEVSNEALKCWSIIFVQSAAHELVTEVANSLRKTVEMFRADRKNIRVFFVATNVDQCTDEDTLTTLLDAGAMALNIPRHRIFQISNYTSPADIGSDLRTKPNVKKEEELLQLFASLLQESCKPAFLLS